jgi:hypothetical protein
LNLAPIRLEWLAEEMKTNNDYKKKECIPSAFTAQNKIFILLFKISVFVYKIDKTEISQNR